MKLRSAKQIAHLSPKTLAREVARLQILVARWEALWARGGDPDYWYEFDDEVDRALRIGEALGVKPEETKIES